VCPHDGRIDHQSFQIGFPREHGEHVVENAHLGSEIERQEGCSGKCAARILTNFASARFRAATLRADCSNAVVDSC
jgi:hypothetical protein